MKNPWMQYTPSQILWRLRHNSRKRPWKLLKKKSRCFGNKKKSKRKYTKNQRDQKRKSWEQKINDLGIQFEKKFGDTTMNGNNCSKFLRHYSDVLADVPEEISSKYDHLFCLLEASKDLLFRKTCFEILDEEHISCCCMFEELMIEFFEGCFLTKNPFPSITFSLSMLQSLSKNGYQLECFPNKQSKVCMPLATK